MAAGWCSSLGTPARDFIGEVLVVSSEHPWVIRNQDLTPVGTYATVVGMSTPTIYRGIDVSGINFSGSWSDMIDAVWPRIEEAHPTWTVDQVEILAEKICQHFDGKGVVA